MKPVTMRCAVAADADATFRLVTDIERLPEWNAAITRVIEHPAEPAADSQWVVEVSALGQRWPSRSTLVVWDPNRRHFSYRSGTDDGNPSHTDWSWTVTETTAGCELSVTWSVKPKTFWRRLMLAHVRAYQLRRTEVPASLGALQALAARTAARAG